MSKIAKDDTKSVGTKLLCSLYFKNNSPILHYNFIQLALFFAIFLKHLLKILLVGKFVRYFSQITTPRLPAEVKYVEEESIYRTEYYPVFLCFLNFCSSLNERYFG